MTVASPIGFLGRLIQSAGAAWRYEIFKKMRAGKGWDPSHHHFVQCVDAKGNKHWMVQRKADEGKGCYQKWPCISSIM